MRVSIKQLESLVTHLNEITNSPLDYNDKTSKKFKANIGHYTLSGAYGGYELQRIMNHGGGVETPLYTGHIPKRELFDKIHIFIKGIQLKEAM